MRARRHAGGDHGDEHGIDLAPMLDFVLNLLIFFIITTSFVREPGVFVNAAEALTGIGDQNANILIAVRSNGEIWMDRRQVDIREVRPLVERLHLERPEDTVIVVADKGATSGLVAQVMDEVKLGGIDEVGLGTATAGGG
jgi:biopolymer transport protein ExbD